MVLQSCIIEPQFIIHCSWMFLLDPAGLAIEGQARGLMEIEEAWQACYAVWSRLLLPAQQACPVREACHKACSPAT
jgi:hypothetical protein